MPHQILVDSAQISPMKQLVAASGILKKIPIFLAELGKQAEMLNKEKLNNLAGEIWKSAERLRGKFKAYEYSSPNIDCMSITGVRILSISGIFQWYRKYSR